jgi:LmbE family N-acetylglucosaminyl deacetylase
MPHKTALVVSAHSADFVWRAGGAIAAHVEQGYAVTVVCLSFGERGESAKLWRKAVITLDTVKADRRREAENAAKRSACTISASTILAIIRCRSPLMRSTDWSISTGKSGRNSC